MSSKALGVPIARSATAPYEGRSAQCVVIEATHGWASLGLSELWRFRELVYFLAWRDIKIRYRQTVLGGAWAILQPLVAMIVFTLVFGRVAHLPSDGVPYAVFTLVGLLPWTYFAYCLQQSGASMLSSSNMITKVYFPRLALPVSTVIAGLVDFGISLLLLACTMLYLHVAPDIRILALPVFVAWAVLASLAVSTWTAALSVRYRDVKHAIPFVAQVWLFASPVAYGAGLVHGKLAAFYMFNPLAGVIEGFRWSLLGIGAYPDPGTLLSLAVTFLLAASGLLVFRRMERSFADVI